MILRLEPLGKPALARDGYEVNDVRPCRVPGGRIGHGGRSFLLLDLSEYPVDLIQKTLKLVSPTEVKAAS